MEIKEVTTLVLDKIGDLLIEGRVEDIKNKYPSFEWVKIDNLTEMDPSTNNKYLSWLAKILLPKTIKWYKENPHPKNWRNEGWSSEEVPDTATDERWYQNDTFSRYSNTLPNDTKRKEWTDALEHFNSNPSKYEIKDITQYDKSNFIDVVEKAKQKLSRKEMKETGVDKVFENEDFILLMPKTHKAACRYGSRTKWCVTMRGHSGYFERYFTEGPIFFLIDKRALDPTNSMNTEDYYKVAMHYKPFNGQLDSSGARGMKYAGEKNKQEFIDGGNLESSRIDYWNVQDENKKESVVLKYLGGPGRGQKERGTSNLTQLKSAMEQYTKKYLQLYYDSVESSKSLSTKLKELNSTIREIADKFNNYSGKIDELERVEGNLRDYLDYFDDTESLSEEELELFNWGNIQKEKAEEFQSVIRKKYEALRLERDKLIDEKNELETELNKMNLYFYDKEKSVSV